MNKVEFLVQGSASEPYQVTFEQKGDDLLALCNCPAGSNGQYCKHRFQILDGIKKGIVSDNQDDVSTILSWFQGSSLESSINKLKTREQDLENIRKEVGKLKKNVAKQMRGDL